MFGNQKFSFDIFNFILCNSLHTEFRILVRLNKLKPEAVQENYFPRAFLLCSAVCCFLVHVRSLLNRAGYVTSNGSIIANSEMRNI
jgi:hypothetical protein